MSKRTVKLIFIASILFCNIANAKIMSRWAKELSPDKVLPEYPRPQMVRKDWVNLNGQWEYAIRPRDLGRPKVFDGSILVPFCVESALSGVQKEVGQDNRLWYRRSFDVPEKWSNKRILLHFGGVDWETTVWINGKQVGTHKGGYDSFTFDITDALNAGGLQQIVVSVWDPTDRGTQPRGKQVRRPGGIWYTSVTGIWRTVWLEPVPEAHIVSLKIVPDIDKSQLVITANCSDTTNQYTVEAEAKRPDAATHEFVPLDTKLPRAMFVGTPENIRGVTNLEKPRVGARPPFYVPVGTENVAFGKPVTSTDEEPIVGEIEMITDGDKEAADGSYVELGLFLQNITIDLGAEYEIYAILFWHYHKQARVYFDVVVQVADDPDFITNVRTLFNNDHDNSSGLGIGEDLHFVGTAEGKLVDAKGERARYVRLYSNGSSSDEFNHYIEVEVFGRLTKSKVVGKPNQQITLAIDNPKLWSPDSPFLYNLKVVLKDNKGKKVDEVSSYFGMRKISLGKDKEGITRMMLNNEFVFQFGLLDQGWWPDGLYTAPTDEALRYDIEVTKKLGFNLARKHVKIEPARWYYWCDKLGLLVWQDMPSGDRYIDPAEPDIRRSDESARQFKLELKQLIENFGNHPSIVVWVPYNEGWGQYDTPGITNMIKELDPTRLVNSASGWTDRGTGDIYDIHDYPGPSMPEPEADRAVVLGEFGGLGLPVKGHLWRERGSWGYRDYKTSEELTDAYRNLIRNLQVLIGKGLSAAVYTQTTDVEVEVNGMMTYDRVIKMDLKDVNRINQGYFPPIIESQDDIFLDSASVKLFNVMQSGEIKYTLDGSEPDKKSKLYTMPLTFRETTTIKARAFWPDGTKSTVSEYTCKKVSLRQPQIVSGLKPGLRFEYFEDPQERWSKLPDFSRLTPKASGIAAKCDLSFAQRDEYFALKFEGFVSVPNDGIYTFYTNSDDGSKLYIGSTEVVENDYSHPMTEKSGQIALKAGIYPIKLTFYQGMGGKGLEVSYKGPGVKKQQIPPQALFHAEKD